MSSRASSSILPGAGAAHAKPVDADEDGERSVGLVEAFGSEQESIQLGPIQAAVEEVETFGWRTYWAGLEPIRPSLCAKQLKTAHRR
jgi:hypothetical protein